MKNSGPTGVVIVVFWSLLLLGLLLDWPGTWWQAVLVYVVVMVVSLGAWRVHQRRRIEDKS